MSERIVVDPVTRIEGHLRLEVRLDGGQVAEAWSSATMWRGLETILEGRDPRDAWLFAQRICGVCTTVHALASVRAVEDALGLVPPPNARTLRDLIAAAQAVHDHVVHFYHLHALDWVDVTAALKADPGATARLAQSLSAHPRSTKAVFAGVRDRFAAFVRSGRLGPFTGGYWGHPAYRLPPEADLLALSHYLDALDFQRDYARVHALLGGKNPHPQTYLVGGMAVPIDPASQAAINDDTLQEVRGLLLKGRDFVRQVYLPDLFAIAAAYPEWGRIGRGLGTYLAFGDYSAAPPRTGRPPAGGLFPGGLVRDGDLSRAEPFDPARIAEYVTHSWFAYDKGDAEPLAPWSGETRPAYTGPAPPYEHLDVERKYSWLKSPRYGDLAVEVGPLARIAVGYAAGDGGVRSATDAALTRLHAGRDVLFSTLGRMLARGLETGLLADHALDLLDRLTSAVAAGDLRVHDGSRWDPATWPASARGVGFHEAPRGGLSHWVVIENRRIARYQAVVPSTWNAGPRDAAGRPGAYEAALAGTPVADPRRPLEILRTVHSFDPCMACAAHVLDADGRPVVEVRVQ
ncbi:nickel-dependent hydrogenase large subunit [Actinomadura sp. ATCC 31491]|uniref:Nickel-dependent hydrogenase large subunit n=1 Tax=Actinomadura luzonensis TaxID=2805427 RepID=A0ABT0FX78_9ACTN|nr:nickel-dependent hydrogenase large subunit [Actinomadura luzonensis]MCK2216953.1 nickel-dependent hydrogenase large subunit [Actinomadura luzonensis]